MVKQSTFYPKFEGSNPGGSGREKIDRDKSFIIALTFIMLISKYFRERERERESE